MLAVAICCMCACSKDDVTPEVTVPAGTTNYFNTGLDFDSKASEKTITFQSNVPWTVTVADTRSGSSWCSASPASGEAGTANVKIAVLDNASYDDRSAVVRVAYGDSIRSIFVNQKQLDALTLTSDRFEVPVGGGTVDVEVKANIDYTYKISDDCKDWIHPKTSASTRALTTSHLTFTVDPSQEYDKREGHIEIISGDKKETVTVYQVGEGILTLTNKEFDLSSDAQDISIEVSSNFEYSIDIPEVDWITEDKSSTRGVSTHTIRLHVDANKTYDDRMATVRVYDKNSDLSETIIVNQKQLDALTLTSDRFEVPVSGGTVDVEVKANIDYTYKISDDCKDWIHPATSASTRALTTSHLTFTVDPSQDYDKREGHIEIVSGDKKETVTVYQVGAGILTLTNKEFNLSSGAQDISIEVSTNFDYTLDLPQVDWITEVPATRGVTTYTIKLHVAENTTYDDRSATIKVYDKNSDLSESVIVRQSQKSGLQVSQSEYSLDENGGTITVNVNANVDYQVKIGDSWITETPATRALTTKSHTFKVAAMTGTTDRQTKITFSNNSTGAKADVVVKQTNTFFLEKAEASLMVGSSMKLSLTNKTGQSAKWESSNFSVATVDNQGNIKGIAKGVATIKVYTPDGKHSASCKITIKDVTDYIYGYCAGGAMSSINGKILYGSKMNWCFSNGSPSSVTLKSMQLVDGVTGEAGNEMSVDDTVAAGKRVTYAVSIGLLGINLPVTCRFKYEYNGTTYTTEAVYKGSSW